MRHSLIVIIISFSATCYAQESKKKNKVIIQYQQRQKVDLGELSVEGNVLTPGDFSIDYEDSKTTMELHKRRSFKDKIKLILDTPI